MNVNNLMDFAIFGETAVDQKISIERNTRLAQMQVRIDAFQRTLMYFSDIITDLTNHGARLFWVGGIVRDAYRGVPFNEADIEVHGISGGKLAEILGKWGHVSLVGASFGVYKLFSLPVDWSLPRTDARNGGRHPDVSFLQNMNLYAAAARRDVTINALMIDIVSNESYDFFNGFDDIDRGVLRACDETFFGDDPLRLYRVMQFVGRFEFFVDDSLNAICAGMDVSKVSRERVEEEFKKLFFLSKRPSLGLRWLKSVGVLDTIFPELGCLSTVSQKKEWHPEGSVFEHTMQTLDAAAHYTYASDEQKLDMLYAALCHDMGKALVTDTTSGKSHGHDEAAVPVVKSFMRRIMHNQKHIDRVVGLVRYHMMPLHFYKQNVSLRAFKRLAIKTAAYGVCLNDLAILTRADALGRNGAFCEPLTPFDIDMTVVEFFTKHADIATVLTAPLERLVLGRDLMPIIAPGPKLGEALAYAYELQIEKDITDKQELIAQTLRKYV
ncbi:MAG: tRNA nucleotidyltransferase/poly(A) polymerase [candidate division TM6 bacterium GW2011_GWE2_41_16]|nr:MAG: tRNA nucleotidyltransferase/poly(A) polymerase [candidate division TM6 bacterium GW2011_GWE2_41_16]